jgi:hypothetical protein
MTTSPRSSGTAGSSPRGSPATRCARARWRSPAWSTRPCAAGATPSAKGPAAPARASGTRCPPSGTRTTRRSASSSRRRTSRSRSSSSARTCRCSRACCRGRSRSRCSRGATTTSASIASPSPRPAASCAGSSTTGSSASSTTCSRGPRRRRPATSPSCRSSRRRRSGRSFAVGSDECKGDGCPFREECFSERAKAVAQGADIIVTNYHLLFAHLAVRRETGQDLVLPAHDLLILDEAHEAADIAREFFGFTVSEHTFARLATAAADFGHKQLAGELRQEAGRLFERLADFARSPRYKKRLKAPGFASDAGVQRALRSLVALATARAEDEARDQKERATARNVAATRPSPGRGSTRGCSRRTPTRSTGSTSTEGPREAARQAHRRERAAPRRAVRSLPLGVARVGDAHHLGHLRLRPPRGGRARGRARGHRRDAVRLRVAGAARRARAMPDPRDPDFIDEAVRHLPAGARGLRRPHPRALHVVPEPQRRLRPRRRAPSTACCARATCRARS